MKNLNLKFATLSLLFSFNGWAAENPQAAENAPPKAAAASLASKNWFEAGVSGRNLHELGPNIATQSNDYTIYELRDFRSDASKFTLSSDKEGNAVFQIDFSVNLHVQRGDYGALGIKIGGFNESAVFRGSLFLSFKGDHIVHVEVGEAKHSKKIEALSPTKLDYAKAQKDVQDSLDLLINKSPDLQEIAPLLIEAQKEREAAKQRLEVPSTQIP